MPARRRSPGGYRIPLEHLRWYAAFHRKEDSVHIHMVVFSSNLKEGYLTKQGIRQVKSAFPQSSSSASIRSIWSMGFP